MELYSALHRVRSPEEARSEHPFELRQCEVTYLGRFSSAGQRLDGEAGRRVHVARFAARTIAADLQPLVAGEAQDRVAKILLESGTPAALCRLLECNPELLNQPDDLVDRIADILGSGAEPPHPTLSKMASEVLP
jgi:hypothetical protein